MNKLCLRISAWMFLTTVALPAADRDSWPAAVQKLKAPYDIAAPKPPSSMLNGADLRKDGRAREFVRGLEREPRRVLIEDAIKGYHWHIAASADSWGRADLAKFYAAAGDIPSAVYWLQKAAVEEGILLEEINQEPGLAAIISSPSWQGLKEFISSASLCWQQSSFRRDILVLPKGYATGKKIPLLIALHGHRGGPAGFIRSGATQKMCDQLQMGLLSISGPIVFGPHSFAWPVDLEVCMRRIQDALEDGAACVSADKSRLMMVGFSAGAQIAAELAARHPDQFLGAMVLCSGKGPGCRIGEVDRPGSLAGRRFLIINGELEHPGNLEVGARDAQGLEALGAKVLHVKLPKMGHQFPTNYDQLVAEWVKVVLEAGGKP